MNKTKEEDLEAKLATVRALDSAGQIEEARSLCLELVRGFPGNPEPSLLLGAMLRRLNETDAAASAYANAGRALLGSGKPAAAAEALETAVHLRPDDPQSYNDLGRARNNQRQPRRALAAFRYAIRLQPDFAEAHNNIGHVQRMIGNEAAAEESFAMAAQCDPDYASAHHNLGLTRLRRGRHEEALEALDRALAIAPRLAQAQVHRGAALHHLERYEEALAAYGLALAEAPNSAEAYANRAITLHEMRDHAAAARDYQAAIRNDPRNTNLRNHLCDVLLAAGQAQAALDATSDALQKYPGLSGVIAARALALARLDRRDEAAELYDYSRFLVSTQLSAPAGFAELADFNDALARHVSAHPSLVHERAGHATRRGRHSGELLEEPAGPVAVLADIVEQALQRYRDNLVQVDNHPFLSNIPSRWRLTMWAVIMDSQGHQLPHIHPGAWVSGVYYVRLPDELMATDTDPAAWIEFGLPPEDLQQGSGPALHLLEPSEGQLLLFPSYFYHRTIPFESDQPRISIAFDAVRI